MEIYGLQKLTLLDYPGLVACTLFTGGCNFRCPFCHNAPLVLEKAQTKPIPMQEVEAFLHQRRRASAPIRAGGLSLLYKKFGL